MGGKVNEHRHSFLDLSGANTACDISNIQGNWVSTGFGSRVCASSPTNNPGCGYNEPPDAAAATYGESFNAAGGAVYALLLNHAGSTICAFLFFSGVLCRVVEMVHYKLDVREVEA